MRIVVDLQACQNSSRLQGIGRYAMAMTRALLKVGAQHEIWIALNGRFPATITPIRRELAGLIAQDRIVVFHLPSGIASADPTSAWRSRAAEALREHFLASLNPDMVFVPSLFEGYWDEFVASIGRQPIATAVTVHDLIPLIWPDSHVFERTERAHYNRMLLSMKRADLWLAVSEYSRSEVFELVNLPEYRVINTSEAIEERFRPTPLPTTDENELRTRLGLSKPFLMFTGSIVYHKNVEGLVRAYGGLPAGVRRDHQLALVGSVDDRMRGRIGEIAREVGLKDSEVVLTGYVSEADLIKLYGLCHLFVFPSWHEGFGLPLLEAMACGAPVVGSNVNSIPEVIGREDALFDPYSLSSMTGLLKKALTDTSFRTSLLDHSIKRASQFSWAESARRAIAGFESVHAARTVAPVSPTIAFQRPRLAYVSPLPPLGSEAAGRTALLLPELARHYDITLVSDQPDVDAPWLTANFPLRSTGWFHEHAERFDRIVYDVDGSSGVLTDLMSRHQGVVILGSLFIPDAASESGDWLYETHGYDAAALAVEQGRDAVAAAFPLIQGVIAAAAGVVTTSDQLSREALHWFGPIAVSRWCRLAAPSAGWRLVADDLAGAIEAFSIAGPAACKARLIEQISAECSIAPSEADLTSVARAIAANTRPSGRAQLLVDVSSVVHLSSGDSRRATALEQVAGIVRDQGFGRRVEPVYFDGRGFQYARTFTCEALGLTDIALGDEPVQAFAGDVFLALGAPLLSCLAPLATLQDLGVNILFALDDAPRLGRGSTLSALTPILRTWFDQVIEPTATGGVWLSSSYRQSISRPSPADEVSASPNAELERLKVYWSEGVDARALLIGSPGSIFASIRQECRLAAEFSDKLFDLTPQNSAALEEVVSAAAAAVAGTARSGVAFNYTIRGHVLGTYSLALINRAVARSLEHERPGHVRLDPQENGPVASLEGIPAAERREASVLASRPQFTSGPNIVITQHYPVLAPEGDPDVSLSLFPWEESHAPPSIIQGLSTGFDAVLATSQFTAKSLIDSGLTVPVVSIGQPADISGFADLRRVKKNPREPFVFLHVSSAFPRKGVDVLLAAWARAFRRNDPVRLVLKTFPNPHNDIAERLSELRQLDPDCAEIELIDRDLDQSSLMDLYRHADVVVSPSRGEGYNLPALEAMAAGIPLIVTGHGGHRDFCGPDEARLIKFTMAPSKSHVSSHLSLWAEPDEDDLVMALREMVEPAQREAIESRATRAQFMALAAVDPNMWVRRLETVANYLLERPAPQTPRIAWISSWAVRCGIAEYSRYLLDRFSEPARNKLVVLCEDRTTAEMSGPIQSVVAWSLGSLVASLGVAEELAKVKFDAIVIQHQDGLLSWTELADLLSDSRLADTVTMVMLHNAVHLRKVSEAERMAVAQGLRKSTRVLVHTLSDVNVLNEMGVSQNVTLLPHGATRALHTPTIRDLAAASSAPIIGCHGFFLRGKGADKLIRICAELRRFWPGLRLRLVMARFPSEDSDLLINECQTLAAELGISDAIEWHTEFLAPEQISELISECDILVLAYDERTDSASGAVRVALSSLVPVLTTRVGIFADLDDAVGRIDANDEGEMAKEIAAVLRDTARRREIQGQAKAWLDTHDWAAIAARMEGMITALIMAKQLTRLSCEAPMNGLLAAGASVPHKGQDRVRRVSPSRFFSATGHVDGDRWICDLPITDEALVFGPYGHLGVGKYEVEYHFDLQGIESSDEGSIEIQVIANTSRILASKSISVGDRLSPDTRTLTFRCENKDDYLEFPVRGAEFSGGLIAFAGVSIRPISGADIADAAE